MFHKITRKIVFDIQCVHCVRTNVTDELTDENYAIKRYV